jgi:hypothetical protein
MLYVINDPLTPDEDGGPIDPNKPPPPPVFGR